MVLITGGAGGVGAHLARNFGKLNAKVIIWDVNSDGKLIDSIEINISCLMKIQQNSNKYGDISKVIQVQ